MKNHVIVGVRIVDVTNTHNDTKKAKNKEKQYLHRDEPTPTGGARSTLGRKVDSGGLVADVEGLNRVSPDGVFRIRESPCPGPELLLVQAYGNTSAGWLNIVPTLANGLDSAFFDLLILTGAVPTVQVTPRLVGDDGIRAARLPVTDELRGTDRDLLSVTVLEHMHMA